MKNVHCDQSFMKLCIFDLNDIIQIEIYLTRNKFLILISIFEQTQLFWFQLFISNCNKLLDETGS